MGYLYRFLFLVLFIATASCLYGQRKPVRTPVITNGSTTISDGSTNDRGIPNKPKKDSSFLQSRNSLGDSITINYRYFDSTRVRLLDSSINDFTIRYPVPSTYNTLGNFGTAAQPLIFSPNLSAGWDAGFHSFDIYRFLPQNTRFFQTTKPYTELGYLVGPNAEQMINIMHTQNRGSNFNFVFEYRLINSPGQFRTQNTGNSNFRVNTLYQTSNKRYTNYFIYLANNINASENGGLRDKEDLKSLALNDPFEVKTRLGSGDVISRNPFSTNVNTGTANTDKMLLMRQQYDFGQKDSIKINDSSMARLFYPRLRLQHTLQYTAYTFSFHDRAPADSNYRKYFNYFIPTGIAAIEYKDVWKDFTNEFSAISFPEKKNLNQYIKIGAGIQLLKGNYLAQDQSYKNVYGLAEYRNRTRNRKWDIEANAKLYMAGGYAGNYSAFVSLTNLVNKKLGSYQVGFQNVNRTPASFFEGLTSFPVIKTTLNNENISRFFASLYIPKLKLTLRGNYYFIANYTYLSGQYKVAQQTAPFNLLHIMAEKTFGLAPKINWYSEAHLQQQAGSSIIHVPLFFIRNRFVFEGNFYTNLNLATGVEIKYNTPYKANGYMPLNQQFYFQNSETVNNLPEINLFADIRIKSFKLYIRYENLNSIARRNYAGPNYPMQSRWLRYGIFWNFVN